MNILEEAVIYSTVMHSGKVRKMSKTPYILHPLEVSHIISTITDDLEVITAGVLHDIVEDTDGTLEEIRSRFGERVASLVESETENKYPDEDAKSSWKKRKEESLLVLENTADVGVKILWLSDKLSNIRSIASGYREKGDEIWNSFHQHDPNMHKWYYSSIAEYVELDLNHTGAFKEFVQHINFLWPGTFASEKELLVKYKTLSIDGCKMIGQGAKSKVYRYNDEMIVKVYNEKNTYRDIERENEISRKAFIAGVPTAISFGIVKVGEKYGSVFELLDSHSVANMIARNPGKVKEYAKAMAELALEVHSTDGTNVGVPSYKRKLYGWVDGGLKFEDEQMALRVQKYIDSIEDKNTLVHGDFHVGNIMCQRGEYLLIDMDRLSTCDPIAELSGMYLFYVGFGELDPKVVEDFMGFSYDASKEFFNEFMKEYLQTDDMDIIQPVIDKAALLAYTRLIKGCYKKGSNLDEKNRKACDYYMDKIKKLMPLIEEREGL